MSGTVFPLIQPMMWDTTRPSFMNHKPGLEMGGMLPIIPIRTVGQFALPILYHWMETAATLVVSTGGTAWILSPKLGSRSVVNTGLSSHMTPSITRLSFITIQMEGPPAMAA